jgi:hypothetical protein
MPLVRRSTPTLSLKISRIALSAKADEGTSFPSQASRGAAPVRASSIVVTPTLRRPSIHAAVPSVTAVIPVNASSGRRMRRLRRPLVTTQRHTPLVPSPLPQRSLQQPKTLSPLPRRQYHQAVNPKRHWPNQPANTDPQQQEAASPQMLVVRLPLRYAAGRRVCVSVSCGVVL